MNFAASFGMVCAGGHAPQQCSCRWAFGLGAYGKLTAAQALGSSAVRSAFSLTWCHELSGVGRLAEPILVREQGEDEGHAGPFSRLAFGLDASAVGFGYGLGYGEAQAVARLLDAVQPVEALEDVR
jgi:hypothetical protein